MKFRATLYPNNEVRLALYPERLPKDYLKESLALVEPSNDLDSMDTKNYPVQSLDSPSDVASATLDIKSKVDTVSRTKRFSLSRNGRRQVLRAGACFGKGEDSKRLLLTGTLPGSTYQAMKAIALFSTYVTKTLTNWLTRRSPGCSWMYTWEFQKRGALHLHLVVELPLVEAEYVQTHFKDEWNRILRTVCSKSGTNLYRTKDGYTHRSGSTQADVTICDREPSRYISKYISKGSGHGHPMGCYPPSTWYQISRALLARLRDCTKVYEVEGLSYRQARSIEEAAVSAISSRPLGGHSRFKGSCYSWSGYLYCESFDIQEISPLLQNNRMNLLSPMTLAKIARQVMKSYPASIAYSRAIFSERTLELLESGRLSETEALIYIDVVLEFLAPELPKLFLPYKAASLLSTIDNWYLAKYGHKKIDDGTIALANKILEEGLTPGRVRTTVDLSPSRLQLCLDL